MGNLKTPIRSSAGETACSGAILDHKKRRGDSSDDSFTAKKLQRRAICPPSRPAIIVGAQGSCWAAAPRPWIN